MAAESAIPAVVLLAKKFAESGDVVAFQQELRARYSESTLLRLLEDSSDPAARRAAVLALGVIGTLACNDAIAGALRDDDATLRQFAEQSLWAIWFRGDTDENNGWLRRVSRLISSRELDRAVELATSLIDKAPKFAEAYNQRAIAYWMMRDWEASIVDCKKVLELNPHHFGAMGGMGQCYVQLGDFEHAVEAFEKAMGMNRNLEQLQAVIDQLRRKMQR